MADENPYMTNQPTRRRGAHFAPSPATAPVPVAPQRRRRKRRKWPLVVLLLLALGAGGFFGWKKFGDRLPALPQLPGIEGILSRFGLGEKTVTITLNGEEARVADGSTVLDVFEATSPNVVPGNLLSVSGAVLEEGQGDAFAATLDGAEVSVEDAAKTAVVEHATLTFADGADRTEDYSSETVVGEQPKLVRKVKEGTSDAGYMVQQGVVQYVYQWGRQGSKELRTGAISGETVEGEVVEGQDCIIMCQDIHPDNDEKLVALTFDDGPTNYTQPIMDILARYDAKGTFNLIGEQVEDTAEVAKANAASGNQICSHTWHHPDLTTIESVDDLRAQLSDTFDVIKRVTGYDTTTIRAPYGDIDFDVWLKSGGVMSLAVYWTHDSEDWKLPGVDYIVSNCTSYMAPGSVILMHDGGGDREQNLEAIPRIIEAWQDAGYRFVTIEELMASDSSIPSECCATYRPMPEDAVWPTEKAEAPDAQVVD